MPNFLCFIDDENKVVVNADSIDAFKDVTITDFAPGKPVSVPCAELMLRSGESVVIRHCTIKDVMTALSSLGKEPRILQPFGKGGTA